MNARYYNPNTGRFLSQDSYKGSMYEPWTQNLYSYVGNNPVNFTDPTGHNPILIAAVIVLSSALVGRIIGGIFSASRGDGFWSGAAGGAVSGSLGSLGAVAMFFSGGTMSPAVFTLLGLSGFAGGYEGSVVSQTVGKQIDDDVSLSEAYKAVDHDEALYNETLEVLAISLLEFLQEHLAQVLIL